MRGHEFEIIINNNNNNAWINNLINTAIFQKNMSRPSQF